VPVQLPGDLYDPAIVLHGAKSIDSADLKATLFESVAGVKQGQRIFQSLPEALSPSPSVSLQLSNESLNAIELIIGARWVGQHALAPSGKN